MILTVEHDLTHAPGTVIRENEWSFDPTDMYRDRVYKLEAFGDTYLCIKNADGSCDMYGVGTISKLINLICGIRPPRTHASPLKGRAISDAEYDELRRRARDRQ